MGKSSKARNKQRKHNHYQFSDSSSTTNNAHATEDTSELDIPGYYYDKEKKRYFKILSNSQSSVSSFITKDTIKKTKSENQRLLDRDKESRKNGELCTATSSTSSSYNDKDKNASARNCSLQPLFKVLNSVQCGQYTCQSLQRNIMGQRCQRLKPQPGWENGKKATVASSIISPGDILRMEVNADCDKAVTIWSQKGIMLHWMQLIDIKAMKKKETATSIGNHLNLSIENSGEHSGSSMNKVTSLCWCPLSKHPDKTCVVYTTVCPIGYSGSRVSVINLGATSCQDVHMFSFDLGRHSVWSCAWNKHKSQFSVGCERKTHVIDIYSRCKWTYLTQNSDSLSQLFSNTNPNLLYTGTRNGFIFIIDMRASHHCREPAAKFNHKHPVVCVKTLKDENYLMGSDYSGVIRTWDVRFQKTVKRFTGLTNTHYQLPFYVDDTEKFVYATGSDGYCKIWDAKDEFLLKSIAPPLSVHSSDSFPVSHLSERWGGRDGNFGLVTAMTNKFFMYS